MRDRLLIVDDEVDVRKLIANGLERRFEIAEAGDPTTALERFRAFRPGVVTLDLRLTGPSCGEGMGLLRAFLTEDPTVKILMVTADTEESTATRAVELGAWDYYTKPIVTNDLEESAVRAITVRRLQAVAQPRSDVLVEATDFETWLGRSELARRLARLLQTLAEAEQSVMIVGEAGTGRELAARALHELGTAIGGFVHIDCGGPLPDPDELPEAATIYLEDVEALDALTASTLDRWLERASEGRRIVASATGVLPTGRLSERAVGRLATLTARLPALRTHAEDIPHIATRLLRIIGERFGARPARLDEDAEQALVAHRWPGNFRELEKRILGAALVTNADTLSGASLWPSTRDVPNGGLKHSLAELEKQLVRGALREHNGNVSRSAAALDISRPTLHALLRKHDIDPAPYRRAGSG